MKLDPVFVGAQAPANGTAARVIGKAKEENQWRPMPKERDNYVASSNVLPTIPLPFGSPVAAHDLIGKRRDRLIVIGYSAEQGSKKQQAKWVVRCDCGNYEHRTRIFRWIGTKAPDMCRECAKRTYILKGETWPREPAKRKTIADEAIKVVTT